MTTPTTYKFAYAHRKLHTIPRLPDPENPTDPIQAGRERAILTRSNEVLDETKNLDSYLNPRNVGDNRKDTAAYFAVSKADLDPRRDVVTLIDHKLPDGRHVSLTQEEHGSTVNCHGFFLKDGQPTTRFEYELHPQRNFPYREGEVNWSLESGRSIEIKFSNSDELGYVTIK